jgi:hypothetical protein
MAWTLANHIDRGTTETIQDPLMSACWVVFMAFFAGGEFVYHFTKNLQSSFTSGALHYFILAIVLGIVLERAYFLARAIRQLRTPGLHN